MVEYYKTNKGYYYKKTTKKITRIKKDEYENKTKNGGKISIRYKRKLNGGGKNCECNNPIDLITLEPIEKDFDENNINNFIIRDENNICYCFKIYDLYKLIFLTDIPLDVNNKSKMSKIREYARDDFNPYTNKTLTSETLKNIVLKYYKWTENKGPTKTISYNGVKFNRKDFKSILDEYEEYKTRYSQISTFTTSKSKLELFMDFTKDLLEYTNSNSNNNNTRSVGSNVRSVGTNNSGRPSFSISRKTLKAIISYIRDKKLY